MKTHPLSIGHLVVGLIFVGLSLAWLLDHTGAIDPQGFRWLVPAVLLGAGLVGLSSSLGRGYAQRRPGSESAPRPAYAEDQAVTDTTTDLEQGLEDHNRTTQGETS